MADAMRFDFQGDAALAGLDDLQAASEKALRPAVQAGADELYTTARIYCPVSAEAHYFYGTHSKRTGVRYLFEPGNLRNAIYQAFSQDNSMAKGAGYSKTTYHIAWRHKQAPYGYMVEFGTSRAPATSFIRRAYESMKHEALQVTKAHYLHDMRTAIGVLK